MIVYTIQHLEVFNKIFKNGQYQTDKRFICAKRFDEAYAWYVDQAKKRIENWIETRPIWVWTEKPDLRSWKTSQSSSCAQINQYVLLTLEIPNDQILLSNFDLWHFVLNGHNIPYRGKKKTSMNESWNYCLLTEPKELKPIVSIIGDISYKTQGIIQSISKDQIISFKEFSVKNIKI